MIFAIQYKDITNYLVIHNILEKQEFIIPQTSSSKNAGAQGPAHAGGLIIL
jgi:hypothetical protein